MARYQRMRGFNVPHPMVRDSFGLPAEQSAIKTGTHPPPTTPPNIRHFTRQTHSLGFSYELSPELEIEGATPDRVLGELLDSVEAPRKRGPAGVVCHLVPFF